MRRGCVDALQPGFCIQGSFRACGRQLDQVLTLTTSLGPDRSVVVETRIPRGQFVTSVLVDWRESGR